MSMFSIDKKNYTSISVKTHSVFLLLWLRWRSNHILWQTEAENTRKVNLSSPRTFSCHCICEYSFSTSRERRTHVPTFLSIIWTLLKFPGKALSSLSKRWHSSVFLFRQQPRHRTSVTLVTGSVRLYHMGRHKLRPLNGSAAAAATMYQCMSKIVLTVWESVYIPIGWCFHYCHKSALANGSAPLVNAPFINWTALAMTSSSNVLHHKRCNFK